MSKLAFAVRDGFVDSLLLAIAIPAAIFSGLRMVAKSFLRPSAYAVKK
jgi:hypothetical protein